jgi:hypothetical protein
VGTYIFCWLLDERDRPRLESEGWIEIGRGSLHGTPFMEYQRMSPRLARCLRRIDEWIHR